MCHFHVPVMETHDSGFISSRPFSAQKRVHAFLSEPSHGSGAQSGHTPFPLACDALKSAGNWSEIQIQLCNTEFWDLYWRRKPKTGFWITGAFGESLFLESCLSSTRDSDSGAVGLEVFLQKAWSQQRVVRIHSWIAEWFSSRWSYRSSCYYGCTSGFTKSAECETRFR